jgi:hypothetical protein
LIEPEEDGCGDDDCGHEGVCGSVITCGDPAPILEFGEHVFDPVALPVERAIIGVLQLAGLARRDAGHDPLGTSAARKPSLS